MNDDQIFKFYPEIVRQFSDRDAAQIHECLRLGEQNGAVGYFSLSDMGVKEGLTDGYVMLQCQLIHDQETRVMPVHPIPHPRISQSYDQFHANLPQGRPCAGIPNSLRSGRSEVLSAFGFLLRGLFCPRPAAAASPCSRRFRLRYGNLHDGDHRYADITRIEDRQCLPAP